MAKIKRLKNGKYQVQVYDDKGIRMRPSFDKKAEAEAFINKIEAPKIELKLAGKSLRKARTSFSHALEEFRKVKHQLRPSSIRKYDLVINQFTSFVEALKITYLDQFTTDHATLFYNELTKEITDENNNVVKAKPKTVNFYLQTIKSFFMDEVIKGHISQSPMLHIKNQKVERKHPDYYSEEELSRLFLQQMPDHLRNALTGLLHTGMRIAEMENLNWNDIDLKKRLIHIRPKGEFKTKTFNSQRSIPMNDTMFKLLTRLTQDKKSKTYVFTSMEGSKLRERKALDELKKVGKAAGITSRVYLHKFRHTYATYLVQKGVRIEVVQKLLGHASIEETMVYAYIRPDILHLEVSILDNLNLDDLGLEAGVDEN